MTHRRALNVIALILVCVTMASAQSMWEGTAVVGRYGDFPPDGLFVASASFAVNSVVDVMNLNSGRSARLVVVRQASDPGILMVLSAAAANQLGFGNSQTAMVRARVVAVAGLTAVDPNQDLPFHPDPDINPTAALGDPNAALIMPRGGAPGTRYDPDSFTSTPLATPSPAPPASAPSTVPAVAPDAVAAVPPVAQVAPVAPIAPVITPAPQPPLTVMEPHDAPAEEIAVEAKPDAGVSLPAVAVASIIPAPEVSAATPEPPTVETPVVGAAPQPVADAPPVEPDPIPTPVEPPQPIIGSVAVGIAPRDVPDSAAASDSTPADDPVEPVLWWRSPAPPAEIAVALPFPDDSDARLTEALVQPTRPSDLLPPDGLALVQPSDLPLDLPTVDDLAIDPPTDAAAPLSLAHEPALVGAPEAMMAMPAEPDPVPPAVAIVPPSEPPTPSAAEVAPRRPALIPDDAFIVLEPAEPRAPPVSETPSLAPPAVVAEVEDEPTVEPLPVSTPPTLVEAPVTPTPPEPVATATPAAVPAAVPTGKPEAEAPTVALPAVEAPAVPRAPVPRGLPIVQRLEPGAVYLQVAAVTSEQSARQAVDTLGTMFPVAVMEQRPAGSERAVYRVMVGPLEEDEKGSVLHWVRNRGYRDAFIRRADATTVSR